MIDMGRDFHAPRHDALAQWRKLEMLVSATRRQGQLGPLFGSCGCEGPGAQPATLALARQAERDSNRERLPGMARISGSFTSIGAASSQRPASPLRVPQ